MLIIREFEFDFWIYRQFSIRLYLYLSELRIISLKTKTKFGLKTKKIINKNCEDENIQFYFL